MAHSLQAIAAVAVTKALLLDTGITQTLSINQILQKNLTLDQVIVVLK